MRRRKKRSAREPIPRHVEPYEELWWSLTPRERLRRAWKLRKRLRNIQKLHDEKLIPRP